MPWKESRVADERVRFIAACIESDETFAELCRRIGCSPADWMQWVERYEREGPTGLLDRPAVPRLYPHRTATELVDAIVRARKEHPFWGPKKLRTWLAEHEPERPWPAPSTIGEALKRNDLRNGPGTLLTLPSLGQRREPCPGKKTCHLEERMRFVLEVRAGRESMACLCRRFGISRQTGYRWAGRGRNRQLGEFPKAAMAPPRVSSPNLSGEDFALNIHVS
jgi:transposase-like protein